MAFGYPLKPDPSNRVGLTGNGVPEKIDDYSSFSLLTCDFVCIYAIFR